MTRANDTAWKNLIEGTGLLQEIADRGHVYVSAEALKRHREPRLMAKLDTDAERPQIFKDYELNVLPVKNGQYIVFKDRTNSCYFKFPADNDDVPVHSYTSHIDLRCFDSFPIGPSFSESQAIDYAHLSNLLGSFCGFEDMRLTIRGRLFSGNFGFQLADIQHGVNVSSVQIEVDAGYETSSAIVLIEAKIGRRSDFHIRQLYYPFLEWSQKSQKSIVPIFLSYSNGKYTISEFRLSRTFGDLSLVRTNAYIINDNPIAQVRLPDLLNRVSAGPEPQRTPFPQADDMDKVVDVVQLVQKGLGTKTQIAEAFEFDERQADYYANAAAYLGFVSRLGREFVLTATGEGFVRNPSRSERTKILIEQMLGRPTLRQAIQLLEDRHGGLKEISDFELASIIETSSSLTGTTPRRRASTVRQWLKWIINNSTLGHN